MPPIIYLVRHAHALDAANDTIRPLSPRGHAEVRSLGGLLRPSRAFAPAEVWYSPLLRARETAELLLEELSLQASRREVPGLVPEGAPAAIAALLARARVPIAVFGHEPHLSTLATLLVTGETGQSVFTFQKATTLALEPAGPRWSVRWQLSPDLFGA